MKTCGWNQGLSGLLACPEARIACPLEYCSTLWRRILLVLQHPAPGTARLELRYRLRSLLSSIFVFSAVLSQDCQSSYYGFPELFLLHFERTSSFPILILLFHFIIIIDHTPQNFSQTPHTFPSTQLPSKPGHRKSTSILSFYLEVLNYALYVCSMTKF